MIETGRVGGSCAATVAAAWATVVASLLGALCAERLPTASPASTVYVYFPGGTFLSTNDVGAGEVAPLFCTVAISTPLRKTP
jgi:hypothetical protein